MKPSIKGFGLMIVPGGFWDVTTQYDLLHLGKPTPFGCRFKTIEDAEAHKDECFRLEMMDYEYCKRNGYSWPYND